jgi:hypothetical protein
MKREKEKIKATLRDFTKIQPKLAEILRNVDLL